VHLYYCSLVLYAYTCETLFKKIKNNYVICDSHQRYKVTFQNCSVEFLDVLKKNFFKLTDEQCTETIHEKENKR
jgi:hypothetical protein